MIQGLPPNVADYSVEEKLLDAEGIGRVVLGRKRGENEKVAIKLLDLDDEEMRAKFLERAEFLKKLEHPNIMRTRDCGTITRAKIPWSATTHFEGVTATELLQMTGPTLPSDVALRLCLSICQALVQVEEKWGTFGDLRCRNIAVNAEGLVRLCDNGFPSRLGTLVLPGTQDYAAPEILEARFDVDVRADIYALGICLFTMVTGATPFPDEDPKPTRIVQDPRKLAPDVNPHIAALISGLCHTDRDRRYRAPREAGYDIVRVIRKEAPVGPQGKFAALALDGIVASSGALRDAPKLFKELLARYEQEKKAAVEAGAGEGGSWQEGRAVGPTTRFKITRGRNFYVDGHLMARDQGPLEVDTDWMERRNYQAAWGEGENETWDSILNKREYYFRQGQSESLQGIANLERQGTNEEALDQAQPAAGEDAAAKLILAEDGSRAYQIIRELGRGGQGVVRLVKIAGDQAFEGFAEPVEECVLKTSKQPDSLLREQAVYMTPSPGIVKLLDVGAIKGRRGYLVMERLYLHPFNMFSTKQGRMSVDVATAVDTFVNLLDTLHGLHTRKEMPLVLCDIKPDNIMLRMSNKNGTPTLQEYLRRIASGHYEPVFMDMGCAQHLQVLREAQGRLQELIGTPIYLPPESIPEFAGVFKPGIYSQKTDVYALTLSFYEYLTADRPYRAAGLYKFKGRDLLFQLLDMKKRLVSPIDHDMVSNLMGQDAPVFKKIFDMGLNPNAQQRATALQLLDECKKVFKVKANFVTSVTEYRYDMAKGCRLVQERYPRIEAQKNRYLDFRRDLAEAAKAAQQEAGTMVLGPDQVSVDDACEQTNIISGTLNELWFTGKTGEGAPTRKPAAKPAPGQDTMDTVKES